MTPAYSIDLEVTDGFAEHSFAVAGAVDSCCGPASIALAD
jgi:hypothetical protein